MKTMLITQLLILLTPVFAQVINTVLHALWNHATRGGAHLGSIIVSFVIGFIAQAGIAIYVLYGSQSSREEWVGALLWCSVTYTGFGFCYFTFVNLARTSLRIRVLAELFQAPNYSLAAKQLNHIYDEDHVAQVRLERLEKWGQISRKGEKLLPMGHAFWFLGLSVEAIRSLMGVVSKGSEARRPQSS